MNNESNSQFSTLNSPLLPRGYKQTEVGVIPDDWVVKRVGEVCGFIVPGRNKPHVFDGNIPWITTPDLEDGRTVYQSRSMLRVSISEAKAVGSRVVPAGSVVMSCVGELGIVALAGCDIVINQQLHAFLPSAVINGIFLAYAIKTQATYIDSIATKTALPYLNKDNCNSIPIPIPPLPEQEAIAGALSDADTLIESLEQLIAKKRHLKQGAMQELLTGKKRLPGFAKATIGYKQTEIGMIPEDWETVNLASVCSEPMQNGVFYNPSHKGVGVKLINVGDLYKKIPIDSDSLELFDANENEKVRFKVEVGDLFFTRSSVVPSGIAHCNIYNSPRTESVVFDSHVIRVRPDTRKIISSYLFRFCVAPIARRYLVAHAKTATMTTIDQVVLGRCPIFLPSKTEQEAIADVLSDMDTEIAALEAKLAKACQMKQGMMHNLLTGRIRLV